MGLQGGGDGGERDGQRGVAREFGVERAATQPMTAAERFAEKKKQAIARKERSTEWASEEDRPSHRRARPETAPEQFGDPTRTEKLESASGGTIRSSTARGRSSSNTSSSLGGASRQHSAEIARMSSASESEAEEGGDSFARPGGKSGVKKPGVVRQKSAEDGRLPATERLFRGDKRILMPRRNKPPYTGVPFTPNVDLAETLREEGEYHGKADWATSRKARKVNTEFLPLPGQTIEETLRKRDLRLGAKRLPGEVPGGRGNQGGADGGGSAGARGRVLGEVEMSEEKRKELELLLAAPGDFQRTASWLKKKKGGGGGSSSKGAGGERERERERERGGLGYGNPGLVESGSRSRTSAHGNQSPMLGGGASPLQGVRSPLGAVRPRADDAVPGGVDKKRSEALEDKIKSSSRIDPVAFQKLSDRFMEARKETASLKQKIAAQKEASSDLEEHVKRLQHELKHRLDSEQFGLRQIKEMQERMDHERKGAEMEKLELKQQLNAVAESVTEGFKEKEDQFGIDESALEELHRQLMGAGSVITAMRRRIEEQQEAHDILVESCRAAEDKCEVLEGQKRLAEQQVKDANATAFDAQKKMKLVQDQLAKVLMRTEKDSEKQDTMYSSIKTTVIQVTKENESLKAKTYLLETENSRLKAQLDSLLNVKRESRATMTNMSGFQGKGNHFYAVHWNPWIWLTALSLIDDGAGPPLFDTGCQTDDVTFLEDGDRLVSREVRPSDTTGVVIRGDVECKDGSAQTEGFDTGRKSQLDVWWADVIARAEHHLKNIQFNKPMQMTPNQLYAAISEIYSAKAVVDEVDDRENHPRQTLAGFLYMHYLMHYGEVQAAQDHVVKIVTNVLAHLKQIKFGPQGVSPVKKQGMAAHFVNKEESGDISTRVIHFARFLGIPVAGHSSIPLEGLNVYLGALLEVRKGKMPLWPSHNEKVLVKQIDFMCVLDWVFAQTRAVKRQQIKTELLDQNGDWETVDLEKSLEFTINAWWDISKKWDTRLESLFTTADVDADGNLDFNEFSGMMEKLRIEEMEIPSEIGRFKMYGEMALYPRVDSKTFVRVARAHDLCKFRIGTPENTGKALSLAPDDEESFRYLEGMIEGIQDKIEEQMTKPGVNSAGVEQLWNILMSSMQERRRLSIAQAFFTNVISRFEHIVREIAAAESAWKAEKAREQKLLKAANRKGGGGGKRRSSVASSPPMHAKSPYVGPRTPGMSAKDTPGLSAKPPKRWAKLKTLTKTVGIMRTASAERRAAREGGKGVGDGEGKAPVSEQKSGERERYLGQKEAEESVRRSSDEESEDLGEFGDHEDDDEDFFG